MRVLNLFFLLVLVTFTIILTEVIYLGIYFFLGFYLWYFLVVLFFESYMIFKYKGTLREYVANNKWALSTFCALAYVLLLSSVLYSYS